jgi:hypothetical protein
VEVFEIRNFAAEEEGKSLRFILGRYKDLHFLCIVIAADDRNNKELERFNLLLLSNACRVRAAMFLLFGTELPSLGQMEVTQPQILAIRIRNKFINLINPSTVDA